MKFSRCEVTWKMRMCRFGGWGILGLMAIVRLLGIVVDIGWIRTILILGATVVALGLCLLVGRLLVYGYMEE